MIYNIDKIYELIQKGLFTEEDCKEYKEYVFKRHKNDLMFFLNNCDLTEFKVLLYVLDGINLIN